MVEIVVVVVIIVVVVVVLVIVVLVVVNSPAHWARGVIDNQYEVNC